MMTEKVVLITGASSGIGLVTARQLAKNGAEVVMICRDRDRGHSARMEVADVATGPAPRLLLADLSSQAAIRTVADLVRLRFPRIDVLINNAGACYAGRELTAEGIERTLATNHLGPFLLTNLLLDLVRAAPAGRIVNVASEVYPAKLEFDNLQGERRYGFLNAYFRSKLENILFTFELARRLEGTGVTANCLSPGPVRTGFGMRMGGFPGLVPRLMKLLPVFVSPEKGARTSIYVASSPEIAGTSGRFFFRCREEPTKPVTLDAAVASRLWSVSKELCGGNIVS